MSRDDFFDVNLQEWDDFFRDVDLSRLDSIGPIVSPAQVVWIERHRRKHKFYERSNRWTPTDLFLWSLGEAPRRDLTQIGGLPYRPADEPWPIEPEDGRPKRFFGQIRFRESRDVAPQAKGEVLLLFCSPEYQLKTEWSYKWRNFDVPPGELALTEHCPAILHDKPGWYGHRCRVLDLDEQDPLRIDGHGGLWLGTKIGGHPARGCRFGGFDPHGDPIVLNQDPATAIGYFATSGSITPAFGCPYPWMNHPAPLDFHHPSPGRKAYHPFEPFMFNLYFRANDAIQWKTDQV